MARVTFDINEIQAVMLEHAKKHTDHSLNLSEDDNWFEAELDDEGGVSALTFVACEE